MDISSDAPPMTDAILRQDTALEAVVRVLAGHAQAEGAIGQAIQPALEAARKAGGARSVTLSPDRPVDVDEDTTLVIDVRLREDDAKYLVVTGDHGRRPAENDWRPVAALIGLCLRDAAVRASLETALSARIAEVAAQRTFIERIIDSLPVGLYVVDREYRIHAWNLKRETGLQGVSRQTAIGRTIFDVLHRQPAAVLKREFDEVFASGRMQQFQMESKATGVVRTFRISKIPMRTDDSRRTHVTHVITIGEDITDWRSALDRTAQSEKLAALGQMATGVMHEINNPLATIAACAETLSLQAEDAQRDRERDTERDAGHGGESAAGVPAGDPRELLRIIDLEVQRCKKIVQGLLDFARPKPVHLDDVDLNAVVRQVMFLMQHHPRGKKVSLVTELEESSPLLVRGDADRLVQVLMALVLNALDASADGARVLVRTLKVSLAGQASACAIDVVDEGHGIPRESLSKVFEPFFTTKDPGRGTGLGLSICYGLVMEHGGVLAVDSALGQGATFRILLPVLGAAPLAAGAGIPALIHEPIGSAA